MCGAWLGQKPLASLCSSSCAGAGWCKPPSEQQGSMGDSSISGCPHCSCCSPNFILLVDNKCRLTKRTKKPIFHPSYSSQCMVRCVCPHCPTWLRTSGALPPAGPAPALLLHQVSALSCCERRKTDNFGDLFPSVLLIEPAWSPIPGRKAPLCSP